MINNNIKESYCSFEVSKLLKEKRFNIPCVLWYYLNEDGTHKLMGMKGVKDFQSNTGSKKHFQSCPTHALAIEWIRVNFNLYIEINVPDMPNEKWAATIHEPFKYGAKSNGHTGDSPQEATEAALLYTLQNLIK